MRLRSPYRPYHRRNLEDRGKSEVGVAVGEAWILYAANPRLDDESGWNSACCGLFVERARVPERLGLPDGIGGHPPLSAIAMANRQNRQSFTIFH